MGGKGSLGEAGWTSVRYQIPCRKHMHHIVTAPQHLYPTFCPSTLAESQDGHTYRRMVSSVSTSKLVPCSPQGCHLDLTILFSAREW